MYFPILRGRQFELLAIWECINQGILSTKIIPIVEPVTVSSVYIKTIESFIKKERSIAIIRNPQVGSWDKDLKKEWYAKFFDQIAVQFNDTHVISSFYVTSELDTDIKNTFNNSNDSTIGSLLLLCNTHEGIETYEKVIGDKTPLYNVISDKGDFRRSIRPNRVMCEDRFHKQMRNIDYQNINTEFFSSDHLNYKEDRYIGFSDYSIIGMQYSETGFAPYAIAIHVVYFDEKNILRIAHFVSDTNDDIYDPARKFSEAAEKLVEWNKTAKLDTTGINELITAYNNKTYPGLGVINKYELMHHLELMSKYLDGIQ